MRNDTIETLTITITDLADVRAGDMVTAEYVPCEDTGAIISGIAYKGEFSALWLAGMVLRRPNGAHGSFLRFVSATRDEPAWEPDEELVAAFSDALARLWGSNGAGAVYKEDARQLLGWLHDNGWLKEDPTDPAPVDPVLDETDKRDRIDLDGDRWRWRGNTEVWQLGVQGAVRGNLAAIDRYYGPLWFADEETDAMNNDKAGE